MTKTDALTILSAPDVPIFALAQCPCGIFVTARAVREDARCPGCKRRVSEVRTRPVDRQWSVVEFQIGEKRAAELKAALGVLFPKPRRVTVVVCTLCEIETTARATNRLSDGRRICKDTKACERTFADIYGAKFWLAEVTGE